MELHKQLRPIRRRSCRHKHWQQNHALSASLFKQRFLTSRLRFCNHFDNLFIHYAML